jgi:hypothetical protein
MFKLSYLGNAQYMLLLFTAYLEAYFMNMYLLFTVIYVTGIIKIPMYQHQIYVLKHTIHNYIIL